MVAKLVKVGAGKVMKTKPMLKTKKVKQLSSFSKGPTGAALTSAGQHFVGSGLCIATSLKGKACCHEVGAPGVVYCKHHMQVGDPSLRVASHKLAGKILVAARDLPKGYRIPLWGPVKKDRDMKHKSFEWAFDLGGGSCIDPTPCKGSLVQYCPCAGPNEVAVVLAANNQVMRADKYGSWFFMIGQDLPKNYQLTMQYGASKKEADSFFEERGIKRVDVGTKAHPAVRRKNLAQAAQ